MRNRCERETPHVQVVRRDHERAADLLGRQPLDHAGREVLLRGEARTHVAQHAHKGVVAVLPDVLDEDDGVRQLVPDARGLAPEKRAT